MGQEMYYLVPLFASSDWLIDDWMWNMIDDYNLSKQFNLPLALTLDEAPAEKLECFSIIDNEINLIKIHESKNGKK